MVRKEAAAAAAASRYAISVVFWRAHIVDISFPREQNRRATVVVNGEERILCVNGIINLVKLFMPTLSKQSGPVLLLPGGALEVI